MTILQILHKSYFKVLVFSFLILTLISGAVFIAKTTIASDIIIDNGDAGYSETGSWTYVADIGYGGDRSYTSTSGGLKTATWTPTIPGDGSYEVFVSWVAHPNRSPNAPYTINHASGSDVVQVDQTKLADGTPASGLQESGWKSLGIYYFNAGAGGNIVLSNNADPAYVVADAVRLVSVNFEVDDDGIECPAADFSSIQAAIDAAPAGQAITVCAGTYSPFSIGAGKDNATVQAQVQGQPLIDASGQSFGVNVTGGADNVTIDGLEIIGDASTYSGIIVNPGSDNAVIKNNIIHGMMGLNVNGSTYGILVWGNDNGGPSLPSPDWATACAADTANSGVLLENNEIYNTRFMGVSLGDCTANAQILTNTIHDLVPIDPGTGDLISIGIQGQTADNVTVQDNDLSNLIVGTNLGVLSSGSVDGGPFTNVDLKLSHVSGEPITVFDLGQWAKTNYQTILAPGLTLTGYFTNIQDALDQALVGGLVQVNIGTYNEDLDINKSVTISGNDRALVIVNNPMTGSDNYGIHVTADNVTLEGMTVKNGNEDDSNNSFQIHVSHVSGFNIHNVTLIGNGKTYGAITGLDLNTVTNVGINNVSVGGYSKNGIAITGAFSASDIPSSSITFANNVIVNNNGGSNGWAGIAFYNNGGDGGSGDIINVKFNGIQTISGNPMGIYFEGIPGGSVYGPGGSDLDLGNTIFTNNSVADIVNAQTANIDATSATFTGASDGFDIEDRVFHAIDASGFGLVSWELNTVYITPNSYEPLAGTFEPSIQRGIDAVAGSTVYVAAGSYTEDITVNKSVNLLGANTGVNPNTDIRGAETVIDGVFRVTANNVVIDGFNLVNGMNIGGDVTTIHGGPGISALTITNNIVTGDSPVAPNRGVVFSASSNSQSEISNNEFTNWLSGIYLNPIDHVTISGNNFHDNVVGIGSSGLSDVSITGNDFTANTGEAFGSDTVGLNVNINNNNIVGNAAGVNQYSGGVINAENNWWGSCSGPFNVASNEFGKGDSASDNVDFDPWQVPCTSQISGRKFNDLNGNGADDSEPGLENIAIELVDLQLSGAPVIDTQLTDINGNFVFNALDAGDYQVREVVPVGYQQTLPLNPDFYSITLVADDSLLTGQDFGNVELGRIIVDKVTDPAGDPASFDFTPDYGSPFSLTDTDIPNDSGPLTPGTYSVSEAVPSGWDLTSATCDDGSDPSTIGLDPGETVTCTFTNSKLPTLTIIKNTIGGDSTFSFNDPVLGTFDLTTVGGTAATSSELSVGFNYNITETVPVGWDLTADPQCSGTLAAGEDKVCTFENTQRGSLQVRKTTIPSGDPQEFEVVITGDGTIFGSSTGTVSDTLNHTYELTSGTYDVTETPNSEWDETNNTCLGKQVNPGVNHSCTITNIKRGHIIVDKVTDPAGDPASFDFTPDYGSPFSLTDTDPPNDSGPLTPGTYSVSEAVPSGWDLTSATCDDGSDPSTIGLDPGETVTCTFTNSKLPTLTIIKEVINDNGGTATENDFGLRINGDLVLSGVTTTLEVGPWYSINEDGISGYDFVEITGNNCPSALGDNVSLNPGEERVCTIVNDDQPASIIGLKFHDLDGDSIKDSNEPGLEGWTIELLDDNGVFLQSTTTDIDGNYSFPDLVAGDYRVQEVEQDGWVKTEPGGPYHPVTLTLGGSEVRNFGNYQAGTIIVDKVTNPSGDSESFEFSPSWDSNFFLADQDTPHNSGLLLPGFYSVSEIIPNGWTLTSATCDDGSDPSAIDLGPGETVTCTFTNTKESTLTVNKIVNNNFGGTATIPDFILYIDGIPIISGQATTTSIGQHMVSEDQLPGYSATFGGDCDVDGKVTLAPGENKTCTITNDDMAADLTVEKILEPDTDPGLFNLEIDSNIEAANVGDGGTTGPVSLSAGLHTISETAGTGTDLSDYIVVFGGACDASGDVTLNNGESKTCTITNTRATGTLEIIKHIVSPADTGIVIDDLDTEYSDTGNWTISGSGPYHYSAAGVGIDVATWTPNLSSSGLYEVLVSWYTHPNRATDAPYTVNYDGGSQTIDVNQQLLADGSPGGSITPSGWYSLGKFNFATGTSGNIELSDDANGYVIADQVKFIKTSDPGLFDLELDSQVELADASDGDTTGEIAVNTGAHEVSESAGSNTDLADYGSDIVCRDQDGTGSIVAQATNIGPLSVPVGNNDDIVCIITNTHTGGTIEVIKDLNDISTSFEAIIDDGDAEYVDSGWNVANNQGYNSDVHFTSAGSGSATATWAPNLPYSGQYEVFVNWTTHPNRATDAPYTVNYDGGTQTIDVNQELLADQSTVGGSGQTSGWYSLGTFNFATGTAGNVVLTNDADEYVIADAVRFVYLGGTGVFDLLIDGSEEAIDVGDGGTTHSVSVLSGAHTVGEAEGTNTDLDNYNFSASCVDEFNNPVAAAQTNGDPEWSLAVETNENIICTITNSRKTGSLEVVKNLIPDTDPGLFDLMIDGSVEEVDVSDGGSTGALEVTTGFHTINEAAGTGTDLANYSSSVECVDQDGLGDIVVSGVAPVNVELAENDTIVCTITNERKMATVEGYKFVDINGDGEWQTDTEPGLVGWTILALEPTPADDFDVDSASSVPESSVVLTAGQDYLIKVSGDYLAGDSITADAKYSVRAPNSLWTDSVQNYESFGPELLDLQIDGASPDWGSFNPNHDYYLRVTGTGAALDFLVKDIHYPSNSGLLSVEIYKILYETTTDSNGYYIFPSLDAGDYLIAEQNQAGWILTSSPDLQPVTAVEGVPVTDINFGNFQLGQVSGIKYEDMNGNGFYDDGEPLLEGWEIQLYDDTNKLLLSTLTDSLGQYSFTNLEPGNYVVEEVQQPSYEQSQPGAPDFNYQFAIEQSGSQASGVNFGNYLPVDLTVFKYKDADFNGQLDISDPPLPNWTIELTNLFTGQESSGLTDNNGQVVFTSLRPGPYLAREVLQSDYIPFSPPALFVDLTSGQNVTSGVYFLNVLLSEYLTAVSGGFLDVGTPYPLDSGPVVLTLPEQNPAPVSPDNGGGQNSGEPNQAGTIPSDIGTTPLNVDIPDIKLPDIKSKFESLRQNIQNKFRNRGR